MPLLRGSVVIATHDADGDLDGLSWQQLDLLAMKNCSLHARDLRILDRRIVRDERQRRIADAARPSATVSAPRVETRTPVRS